MKYAIIRINKKEFKVTEGKDFVVDYLSSAKIEAEVLFYRDEEKILIGKPILENVKIQLKVMADKEKGQKVDIFKYKAKSRYRKSAGFRPLLTRLSVEKISIS
jgi:large subunit ribosomal protein L21